MYKKSLLALKTLNVTMNIRDAMAADEPYTIQACWSGENIEAYHYYWFYRGKLQQAEGKQVLQVSIFTRQDLERGVERPKYRVFLYDYQYVTYEPDLDRWRTATIDHLEYGAHIDYGIPKGVYCEESERRVIIAYTKNAYEQPYMAISSWQSKTKNRKEVDLIDHDMSLVPALPRNFNKWIMETAMLQSRYIYYVAGETEGFCTHCKQQVMIRNQKYGKEGVCPYCKSKIIYKTQKKQGCKTIDTGYASLLQKTKEGFVVRYFEIELNFKNHRHPVGGYWEMLRTVYAKDFRGCREYEWAKFKGTQFIRWCNKIYSGYNEKVHEYQSVIYEKNLDTVLKGSALQYSAYQIFAVKNLGYHHYPHTFLQAAEKPGMEYLIKMGLHNIVKVVLSGKSVDYLNLRGRNPREVFGLPKEQLTQLIRVDGTGRTFEILKEAQECNIRLEDKQLEFLEKQGQGRNYCIYMRHTTPYKLVKYLKKQVEDKEFKCSDYHDYMQQASELRYDLKNEFILFPKHFKQAHDALVQEMQEKEEAIKRKKESADNQKLKKLVRQYMELYAMEGKEMLIRPVASATEMRREGQELHHCVGGYVQRMIDGETVILLIRRKEEPEKPYCTMEVKKGQVVQVRAAYNKKPTKEVMTFVKKFKKEKLEKKQERKAS